MNTLQVYLHWYLILHSLSKAALVVCKAAQSRLTHHYLGPFQPNPTINPRQVQIRTPRYLHQDTAVITLYTLSISQPLGQSKRSCLAISIKTAKHSKRYTTNHSAIEPSALVSGQQSGIPPSSRSSKNNPAVYRASPAKQLI